MPEEKAAHVLGSFQGGLQKKDCSTTWNKQEAGFLPSMPIGGAAWRGKEREIERNPTFSASTPRSEVEKKWRGGGKARPPTV